VETAVVLRHPPSGLLAEANERRSQGENKLAALFRLRLNLALQHRDSQVQRTQPSELWRQRVKGMRIAASPDHDDFPSLLAECMDVLAELDFEIAPAAEFFHVSSSQLVKFLRSYPPALVHVNQARLQLGKHKLR
jgi:hypothetical protein